MSCFDRQLCDVGLLLLISGEGYSDHIFLDASSKPLAVRIIWKFTKKYLHLYNRLEKHTLFDNH